MHQLKDRIILIRHLAQLLRRPDEVYDSDELEIIAEAIEQEAELVLIELAEAPVSACAESPRSLSAREIEVLNLVSNGLPDKQIGKLLGISTFTVNKHVSAILVKMQASSRTEASVRAIMEGFVRPKAS